MASKIRNMVMSFLVFTVLISLIVNFWSPFREGYGITDTEVSEGGRNIAEELNELNMVQGMNSLMEGIQRIGKIQGGGDLIGALALGGVGTLQLIGGVVTFPLEIMGVITGFYSGIIPAPISTLIGFAAVISVGFILLSAKLGFEL